MPQAHKVLMLVENVSVPTDRRVWPEAVALRDRGFQVTIIGPMGDTQDRESHACLEGIHIYRYPMPSSGNTYRTYVREYGVALLMTFVLSLKVLVRHGFDVIHAANPPDIFFLVGLLYRPLGKRFVFDQHDLSPEVFAAKYRGRLRPLHRLLLLLEWCSYHSAHLVITTNESQKRCALTRGGCPPRKVCVVRNGPDLRRFKHVTPEPALKRGRRYLLVYSGTMAVQDGIENALHALHELVHRRGRRDVSLVLLGDGPYAPTLRALAHDLGLDPYVHFTGWVGTDDVLRYLTVADVGLTPDPQNGLKEYSTLAKVMEYMALGKPGVAFDLPETRLTAQDAALYATPNDVVDFASKIETLLDDEALRLRMGARGRRLVEDALAWEHNRKKLVQAYERLFSLPGGPPVSDSSVAAR